MRRLHFMCRQFCFANKLISFLIFLLLSSHATCVFAASLVKVTLSASSVSLFYFETYPTFFTSPDQILRIAEPASINSDQHAWQVTITDAPGGGQRFGLVGWALNGLNTGFATHLIFWVRGAVGFEPFEVGLQDRNFVSYRIRDAGSINHPNVGDYIVGGGTTITTSYQKIRIPLTEFSSRGVNLSNLDAFQIISVAPDGQNITIFVDALGFE